MKLDANVVDANAGASRSARKRSTVASAYGSTKRSR